MITKQKNNQFDCALFAMIAVYKNSKLNINTQNKIYDLPYKIFPVNRRLI